MPNVTVTGPSGVVQIPINSTAAATLAQSALNLVSAAVASNPAGAAYASAAPSSGVELVFGGPANAATITGTFGAMVSNASGITSIVSAQSAAATVVAGTGGLNFTQTAASVLGSLIVAGGGSSNILLAAGANTVSLDITPTATTAGGLAIGTATVNALAGGADVIVNATTNTATTNDNALIALAGADTLAMNGSGFVYAADATNAVTIGAGGAGFFAGVPISVTLAAGNETVGVLTGDTVSLTGATDGTTYVYPGTIYVAGAPAIQGSTFINANSQNVTIFAGAGSTTLFGGTGSDFALDATGLLEAGSDGGSLFISAQSITGVTTIVGGQSINVGDYLFAQSGNVSLLGTGAVAVMDVAGETISGGLIRIGTVTQPAVAGVQFTVTGAPGGDTLNAGASSAFMYGSATGSTTVISGTGAASVLGHAGYTATVGNTYLDGAADGQMTILDFQALDVFKLTGTQSVIGTVTTGFRTDLTLSDGTKISLLSGVVTSSNVGTYFHS